MSSCFSGHPKDSTPEFEAVEKQLAKEELIKPAAPKEAQALSPKDDLQKNEEKQFFDSNFLKPNVPRTSQSSLKDDINNSAMAWGNLVIIFYSNFTFELVYYCSVSLNFSRSLI